MSLVKEVDSEVWSSTILFIIHQNLKRQGRSLGKGTQGNGISIRHGPSDFYTERKRLLF